MVSANCVSANCLLIAATELWQGKRLQQNFNRFPLSIPSSIVRTTLLLFLRGRNGRRGDGIDHLSRAGISESLTGFFFNSFGIAL